MKTYKPTESDPYKLEVNGFVKVNEKCFLDWPDTPERPRIVNLGPRDLSDLTIIMPVRERTFTLIRALDYYCGFLKLGLNIVIVDSSETPSPYWPVIEKQIERRYPEYASCVRYTHTPGVILYKALQTGAKMADTKYVIDIPDDDLLFLPSASKFLDYLDKNDHVVGVNGIEYGIYNSHITYPVMSLLMESQVIGNPKDKEGRLSNMFTYFTAKNHCYFRRDVFLEYCDFCEKNDYLWGIRTNDKLLSIFMVSKGNVVTLAEAQIFRSAEEAIPGIYDTGQFCKIGNLKEGISMIDMRRLDLSPLTELTELSTEDLLSALDAMQNSHKMRQELATKIAEKNTFLPLIIYLDSYPLVPHVTEHSLIGYSMDKNIERTNHRLIHAWSGFFPHFREQNTIDNPAPHLLEFTKLMMVIKGHSLLVDWWKYPKPIVVSYPL